MKTGIRQDNPGIREDICARFERINRLWDNKKIRKLVKTSVEKRHLEKATGAAIATSLRDPAAVEKVKRRLF